MLRQLVAFAFGSMVAAQTFVVDAANGPGTNFLDIHQALAAVPDGAVLIVRAGSYNAFAVNRGVTILGEPGVHVNDGCFVTGTASWQSVTLRGLDWPTATLTTGMNLLLVSNCAGPVLLDRLTMPPHLTCTPGPLFCTRNTGVQIQSSTQVILRECVIACTVLCIGSALVVESCQISGEDSIGSSQWLGARTALMVMSSTAQIAGASQIRGGNGASTGLPGPDGNGQGIWVNAAHLRVLGGVIAAGQTVGLTNSPGSAINVYTGNTSTVRISPRATLLPTPNGSQPAVVGVAAITAPMPQLTSTGALLGTSLDAIVATEPGDLVILIIGFPGRPTVVPGFVDPFWLDAALHWFHAIAAQPTVHGVTGSIPVPNQPYLLGMTLCWQAAVFGPVTGTQASNPSVGLIR